MIVGSGIDAVDHRAEVIVPGDRDILRLGIRELGGELAASQVGSFVTLAPTDSAAKLLPVLGRMGVDAGSQRYLGVDDVRHVGKEEPGALSSVFGRVEPLVVTVSPARGDPFCLASGDLVCGGPVSIARGARYRWR